MKYFSKINQENRVVRWTEFIEPVATAFLFVCLFTSCADQEQSLDERISLLQLEALPEMTHPSNNPSSSEKIDLGRILFWEPLLSGEKNISCATCHHPSLGYADGVELSIGPGGSGLGASRLAGNDRPLSASYSVRNSPTILNSGYIGVINGTQVFDPSGSPLNWHINRRSLEAQAFGPLANPPHMRGKGSFDATTVADTLVKRLKAIAEYVTLFDGVFGGGQSAITKDNIGKAIAAYERSLVTKNSPYDRYVAGQTDALTDLQKQGLIIFFGEGNCANCHSGPMFSDFTLYNLGVKYHPIVSPKDKGALAQNLFRTPTLRNVSLTAPYMHNGTIGTLREVVDFYNKGVSENDSISRAQMSVKVQPLHLSEKEKEALVAFLEALTDNDFDKKIPAKVPSGLKVGGN